MTETYGRYATHIPLLTKLFEFKDCPVVFEFGTGFASTPFFLNHALTLVSLEMQSEEWFEKVRSTIQPHAHVDWQLSCRLGPESYDYLLESKERFDLLFVDGHGESRPECINAGFDLKIPHIVVHDTEYPGYGWERVRQPEHYYCYIFKEFANWTSLYTLDKDLYDAFLEWRKYDNVELASN